jgi:rifampicin phosphotransferase
MNNFETTQNIFDTGAKSPSRSEVGGKGFNLTKLRDEKLAVPTFFILTPNAFMKSLPTTIRSSWANLSSTERAEVVRNLHVQPEVLVEILNSFDNKFGLNAIVAVRSSAAEEDGANMSYAGQFTSVLNVRRNEIAEAIESVWRSGFTKQLIAYRTMNGLTEAPEPPCVILQQMIAAKTAGVAFGADPITGDLDVVVISAVDGLGDKLVSGEVDSAIYRVKESRGLEAGWKPALPGFARTGFDLAGFDRAGFDRSGFIESSSNESLGFLSHDQVFDIQQLVTKTQNIFGCPQDIEWAIDENGQLFILQSRPITTLPGLEGAKTTPVRTSNVSNGKNSNAKGSDIATSSARDFKLEISKSIIFDNSNIGESYPGTTTPLTYSFARKAYQHVYEEFCRLMGVSEKSIEKHAFIFPRMLGFVRGRIYYNLLNWYRLLSLFPGFKTNRSFMEQMMGVKAGLPADFLAEFDKPLPFRERIADAVSISMVIPKLLMKWFTLPGDINAFNSRVENSFKRVPNDMRNLSTRQLAELYRGLEKDLLLHWDAPIVNDFFAMVSFGLLRGICAKWFQNIDGLHNQLLCGETGIISTEPVSRMKEMADIAAGQPKLIALLKSGNISLIRNQLPEYPEFYELYQSYLEKFGDRCAGELKLESPTLVDNPQALFSGVLRLTTEKSEAARNCDQAQTNRIEAEQLAYKSLGSNFIKAFAFNLILNQTRTRIRERENLRFMRTRVFGLVRKIFVEAGKRFEAAGYLNSYQDIFFLETEEVLGFIENDLATESNLAKPANGGNASLRLNSATGIAELVATRKKELESFQSMPAPPDRFSVLDGANLNDTELVSQIENQSQDDHSNIDKTVYKGLGCCPGIVRGYARVIDDPDTQQLKPGEILIAKRTDPGWITVIAQATGIVVEYGSLLSHTAIVSRELGIPTIVSVSNVTTSVKTGDWLEINGATGEVRVTSSQEVVALTAVLETRKVAAMKSEIQTKAGFSFIRYAQCWEDTDIVLEAMNINPGDKCLSIASAGDNSLAMLAKRPDKVVALDLSGSQLALLELKAAAFKYLRHEEMLVLLGYRIGQSRTELFELIEDHLSSSTRQYWRTHITDIESGVASIGKFEKYFAIFRKFILPLVHSQTTIDELLQCKSKEQRAKFFSTTWNTVRWRTLFKVFFSQTVMGLLGRDPSFFHYAEGGLSEALLKWTKRALVDQNPTNNPYLHWILKGEFGSVLPNFLREENFAAIKSNIGKLEWHQLSLEEYLSTHPDERFNSFNLSDVFEYVSETNYKTMLQLIADASHPQAKVVYWNMMAQRTAKAAGVERMQPLTALSKALFAENKTFFYSRFVVEEVRIGKNQEHDAHENTDGMGNKDRAA